MIEQNCQRCQDPSKCPLMRETLSQAKTGGFANPALNFQADRKVGPYWSREGWMSYMHNIHKEASSTEGPCLRSNEVVELTKTLTKEKASRGELID